jgi:hypothetical protein
MPPIGERFELRADLPPALRGVIMGAAWDLARLHELELPIEEVAIEELVWQLMLPWWRDAGRPFVVAPEQVRSDPGRYPEQWKRTMDADLRYPIHLVKRRRWVVLDGVHRLLKARIVGLERIPACRLTREGLRAIVVRRP